MTALRKHWYRPRGPVPGGPRLAGGPVARVSRSRPAGSADALRGALRALPAGRAAAAALLLSVLSMALGVLAYPALAAGVLYLLPAFALFAALAFRRYPGERQLDRLRRSRVRRQPGARAPRSRGVARASRRLIATGTGVLGCGLAVRPPPGGADRVRPTLDPVIPASSSRA